jgi:cell wall-associated NlpC family hydrolase
MRYGALLLVLGVLGAVLGVASARASGDETTTTTGTSTTTTTTTTTQSYAPIAVSSLPAGCVGAGAAAVMPPSQPVVALGTPAANLGPSGYPASGSVVAFSSSSVSGSACGSTSVTLASVSLFDGTVTASSVEATGGQGAVTGLAIDGAAASASAGATIPVDGWGELTLGETIGRLTAPLVLRLLQARDGLPAGTAVAVGFSAAAQPVAHPKARHRSSHSAPKSQRHEKSATTKAHLLPQAAKPPPDFSGSLVDAAFTDAAQHNPVVSIAMRYLGVPYQWGGASPSTGFDCSGLVQYVFAQLGVSLTHYAAAQWYSPEGVWVSPKRLQPGDLVFFIGSDGTRKAPGHVGIYVDNGYIIDAPHTGSFVRIDSLNAPRLADEYVGARRIVGAALAARHLAKEDASAATFLPGFPPPLTIRALGEPLGVAATSAVTGRAPSRGYWIWAGVLFGGLLLLFFVGVPAPRHHLEQR